MKWKDFTHEKNIYSLSHLDPFEWHFTSEATSNSPSSHFKFHVNFSLHCFARDLQPNEEADPFLLYKGPKEDRYFCFDRYELSKQLPDIIKSLPYRPCWHTHHGNYFTIELVDRKGLTIDYEVYFDVTRSSRNGWLNLIVQSAYIRSKNYQTTRPRKRKIGFKVIAYNTITRKIIKPPP